MKGLYSLAIHAYYGLPARHWSHYLITFQIAAQGVSPRLAVTQLLGLVTDIRDRENLRSYSRSAADRTRLEGA